MNHRVQQCRLCGSPIEATLNNPRRVCAACGEVNLPTDGEAVESAPGNSVGSAARVATPRIASTVAVTFTLIALPTPLGGLITDTLVGNPLGTQMELVALGATFFFVLGLVGLFLFRETRSPKERSALALAVLPALVVGWEVCRCAFLVIFFRHWRF